MKTPSLLALAALIALPVAALPAATASAAPSGGGETSYIVQFTRGADAAAVSGRMGRNGAKVDRVLRHVFPGAVARMTPQAAEALRKDPQVAVVERDHVVRVSGTQAGAPWNLDRTDQRTLPLDSSFSWTATGAAVTAYVLDTGIRADHVELAGRVRSGYTAIADGNGTADCHGHGTHVAGTVGGTTYGVAKGVSLVAVRVLGCDGSGSYSGIIGGLDWIVADHAAGTPAVANLSLGGPASSTLDGAVRAAVADGVTVVAAAGNASTDACTTSPAREPLALTVGASDTADARASFSNFGSCLDVFAPGVAITSATPTTATSTASWNGTSMAAPHVAGAVAALLETAPTLSPADVSARLLADTTTGLVTNPGAGSPNRLLYAAAAPAPAPAPAPSQPVVTAPAAPTSVVAKAAKRAATVTWTRGSDGGSALTKQTLLVHSGARLLGTVDVAASATSASISGLKPGTSYAFTVTATNAVGTSPQSTLSNTVVPTR